MAQIFNDGKETLLNKIIRKKVDLQMYQWNF